MLLQNDYDPTYLEDWEDLRDCCTRAAYSMIIDSDCKQLPPQPPPAQLVDTSDPLPPDESLPGVIEVSYCFCWRVLLSWPCVCFGGGSLER